MSCGLPPIKPCSMLRGLVNIVMEAIDRRHWRRSLSEQEQDLCAATYRRWLQAGRRGVWYSPYLPDGTYAIAGGGCGTSADSEPVCLMRPGQAARRWHPPPPPPAVRLTPQALAYQLLSEPKRLPAPDTQPERLCHAPKVKCL